MWADTRHSLYFGVPWVDDCQTVKNRKRAESETQKYGESRKRGNSAFRRKLRFPLSLYFSSARLAELELTQTQSLWVTVRRRPMDVHPPNAMVASDPPQPPRSVEEVLGTGPLPKELVEALSEQFRTRNKEGGGHHRESHWPRNLLFLESPRVRC